MNKKYKNPPVVEALCEIFFMDSKWDAAIPGMFFDGIKNRYPRKKEVEQFAVQVNVSSQIAQPQMMRGNSRIQFVKEDNSQMIQVERDLLVVNQLQPYPRFEDWQPVIDEMIRRYWELAEPIAIKQLGIRYINRIVIPKNPFNMEEYFRLYPQVPDNLGARHGKFMLRLEIPSQYPGHQLVITFATAPSDSPEASAELLDLYDIFSAPTSLAIEEVQQHIIEAHANIEAAFENSITQRTRNLFEEEV
jgi:uncharacterized protein (TIGR04255 family)